MRAIVTIAAALLAVAVSAVATDQITVSNACGHDCTCSASSTETHTDTAAREYCVGGSSTTNATGIRCLAQPFTCAKIRYHANVTAKGVVSCHGTVNTTRAVVCNQCMPIGSLFFKYSCTEGGADLKYHSFCRDASCSSCSRVQSYAGTCRLSYYSPHYFDAGVGYRCNAAAFTNHATTACSSPLGGAPWHYVPQTDCYGSVANAAKLECGGNTLTYTTAPPSTATPATTPVPLDGGSGPSAASLTATTVAAVLVAILAVVA
jgi:hypothetical protein